ncbi:N-acetyltransferase ESCO2 [Sparus aurata]|uniref:Establishment of sister chromatid cohesion N-acetyltransferase 2 n=1 Tax=Sparus aurata TaxID=8175 RepID=A0A671VPS4_SPAAU|nr:N-acetyltransferase ESCO2 [Sparus aurata]XP_030261549.1 N-acetyltransferase ESCO2 [Sparus aurata]
MMSTTTRKRKLPSLDSDSQATMKEVCEEMSPVKRRSPRKKRVGRLDSKNCPSPQKSPRRLTGSPAKSPRKSPYKHTVVTSSFYGKKKPIYLTPLERKAIKESLPSPPPPPLPSPPSQEKKKNKKNVKGGSKLRKVAAKSKTMGKMAIQSYTTSTKAIKLPKLNNSVSSKPAPTSTTTAPTSSTKPEYKKSITISFSSLKPKPKIFVGAAFFGTGKKPTSMYKKSVPKSSNRPASAPAKSKAALPPTKSEKPKQQPTALLMNQQQKPPAKTAVQPVETKEQQPSTKQRAKFDPTDWLDMVDEQPETPQALSSPKMLTKKYGLTKELLIVLTRTPTPSPASTASHLSTQDVSLADLSDISPTSAATSPPKESAALYPIFGSASKRSRKALQPPVSSSTPSGPITSLQTPSSVKERPARRRKEKRDDDQLIIDAGQKQFGATTCSSCGMVYSADNPEDNFQHTQFHQRFLDSIKFVGWKKERVVAEFWDGKILLVMPDDPKYAIKKAEDVRRVADSELGFQQVTLSRPTQAKTYLFINTERMVVGCLVAEPIRQAYRVLEQPDRQKDMTKDDFMERHRAWCCSTFPEQALCGVSRIWVFSLARRQSIATRMLDTVRSSFMYGSHLTKEEIAFSDPTPDGKQFATKYCNTPTFLVYNFIA